MIDTTAAATPAIPDYLQQLLIRIAAREGFTSYSIKSEPGSNIGDGFSGLMLSVVIAGRRDDSLNEKLALICKIPPESEMRRNISAQAFMQEIYAYDTILPALVRFQREKGLTEESGFFSFPKCYGTHRNDETLEFAIVLEDLRPAGYRMWNKYKPIDWSHVKLAVSEMGKFHAISFALREQRPAIFNKFKSIRSSLVISMSRPEARGFFSKTYGHAIASLKPEDTDEHRIMTHVSDNLANVLQASASAESAEPYAVLCHGDFWNNNMMFRYASDDTSTPQRVCLIDWQMTQYSSAVTDLFYYIYSSTEQTLRSGYFDQILQSYHANLTTMLRRLGGDASKQFPLAEFTSHTKKFGVYGLVMAPLLVQVVTVAAGDLPDMEAVAGGENFELMQNGTASGYNVRMSDVIRDFVSRGYFSDEHVVGK